MSKKELIKINFEQQTVDARELHKNLQLKRQFTDWIESQLNLFIKGQDYVILGSDLLHADVKQKKGGNVKKDYILTLDTAKHIAMMSKTEKGREIRQYFIKAEKQYKRFLKMQTAPERIPHRRENLMHNKAFNEAVEEFVKYVEGKSSMPSRYYMIFNNMVNHALFEFPKKIKNIPDKLSIAQLNFSNTAKHVVAYELRKGLGLEDDYEVIKKACKERVLKVADAIGVTPIPQLLENEAVTLIENKE